MEYRSLLRKVLIIMGIVGLLTSLFGCKNKEVDPSPTTQDVYYCDYCEEGYQGEMCPRCGQLHAKGGQWKCLNCQEVNQEGNNVCASCGQQRAESKNSD